jgi:hypothetical protein
MADRCRGLHHRWLDHAADDGEVAAFGRISDLRAEISDARSLPAAYGLLISDV